MGNTEIWDADGYENSNQAQRRDADELLEQIVKDGVNTIEIIVDIGCGSGNVTEMVYKRIPHKKVYASDFDQKMVEYAGKHYNDGTVDYFVQDIGLPWEELDEKLKALEGKVDMVWSNRVLHWVKNKSNAANTISRLLKPGGRCYINVTLWRNVFEFMSEEEKKEMKNFYHFETEEKQTVDYKSFFVNAGLSHVAVDVIEKTWRFDNEEQYNKMASSAYSVYESLMLPSVESKYSKEELQKVAKKMGDKHKIFYGQPYGKDHKNQFPEKHEYFYEQLRIIGTK